jgi:hypothetical protein
MILIKSKLNLLNINISYNMIIMYIIKFQNIFIINKFKKALLLIFFYLFY